ncbi:MAG: RNA polymerase Rpb4 family protein [Candidatus Methanomethylophilaceae archaeon]|jgi:DNA-directed RNA polymerase subunit F
MSEQYVSLAEVRDIMTAEKEKRGLLAVQNATMEHAQTVSRLSAEDAKALVEELKGIESVTDFIAIKIADILPKYPVDVRVIFSKERITLDSETTDRILTTVAKYL